MLRRNIRPATRRVAAAAALLAAGAAIAQTPAGTPASSGALSLPASASQAQGPGAAAASGPLESGLHYPAAARQPVSHTYHGVTVTDDYEWLEKSDDPATRAWVAAENRLSRAWLDAVPDRPALKERVASLLNKTSNRYTALVERGGWIFALKTQPPKQQPLLVRLKSVDDLAGEHVVFDPNQVAANGSLAIDFFEPSLDGRRVAVSVSEGGSEDGTLRVIDVASGKDLGDRVPRAAYPTAGGSVAWAAGNRGFYYTRYPAPGERAEADQHFYQQVWYHQLGTPATKDRYETGRDFPRIAEVVLKTSRDGKFTTAIVEDGDGGEYSLHLRDARGWHVLAKQEEGIKDVRIGDDDALYLLSRQGAPKGKLLRLPAAGAGAKPVDWSKVPVVAPEGEGAITEFAVSGHSLYVADLVGGPSRLRVVDLKGGQVTPVALPAISSVEALAETGHGQVVAEVTSYTQPTAWMQVAPGHEPRRTALFVTAGANFDDCEVVREFATSKDGTKVPLNIIRRKGQKVDAGTPTILYGYGGYGVNITPGFDVRLRPWLDRGGVYVVANIRGGGEFGDAWHQAGNLVRKQNVFDDFIASAEYLVKQGYTSSAKLGIAGGSNGGLLMGAVTTQRPDLFRAVYSSVGIYDMLRVELDPNGAFNVTEFGTVKDPAQFQALYAYSPLHHVKDGTKYPAILMSTGDNDGRVNPAHSRKMIARLQAADPDGRPILLRTSANSGHGIGTALGERIEQVTDQWAFFVNELMRH